MNKRAGFTLIELLVVVLIIGILSAVALPQYQKSVEKARMAEVFTTFDALRKAYQLCVLARGGDDPGCYGGAGNINDNLFVNMDMTLFGNAAPNNSGCFDDPVCIITKNWEYGLYTNPTAFAYRWKNEADFARGSVAYSLSLDLPTGAVSCSSYTDKDTCKSLCGASSCRVK